MQSAYFQQPFSAILYDADRLPRPNPEWVRAEYWPTADSLAGGRGASWRIDTQWGQAVLKHYRRGGLVSKINRDAYWYRSWQSTRALSEWRLLAQMYADGLPVPQPWFAIAQRRGRWYRCALATSYFNDSESLWSLTPESLLRSELWQRVGQLIRRFSSAGVMHPDLNLGNILLDKQQALFMIDFDRARINASASVQPDAMYKRLLRSYQRYQSSNANSVFSAWPTPQRLLAWMND